MKFVDDDDDDDDLATLFSVLVFCVVYKLIALCQNPDFWF